MKKRSIIGWRQVPPAASSLRKRSPAPAAVVAIAPHPPTEPPPKAQWENEGGTVVKPGSK